MTTLAIKNRPTMKEQLDPEYAKIWNDKKPAQRKKLLQDAGYQASNHYSYRAWPYLTSQIRIDVIAVIEHQNRQLKATNTEPQPSPQQWYQKGQYQ